MDDFYREFQTRFFAEITRIQGSLTELKGLVEEDKKLLAKLRKKRSMKAEQRDELVMEREVIDRMAGYTSKITQLVIQKNALKEEVMKKYQKKILLDLIEMDDYEEQKKMIEKHKVEEAEHRKLKELEEKRQIVQNLRKSKLARSFTPVKKKPLLASGSKSPSTAQGRDSPEPTSTMSFKKRNVKAELAEKVAQKKKNVRETMLKYDPNAQHSDFMYQRALKNYYGMEEVRFEMKARKEQEEIASVTFHPKISEKSRQLAQNIPSFKERAFDKIEENRLKAIQERSKSYKKTDSKVLSSASEFKMGKEYHAHMYSKTMKWEAERRRALDSIREHKKGHEVAEVRDRPNSMLKKSKELLQRVKIQ
jgi:hypothetical protein